ncbi:MAG: hypothetical protein OEL56_00620 [Nitrosopumilus sp.]|nr:hypothetical protein [Nitrosopumilus sp.]
MDKARCGNLDSHDDCCNHTCVHSDASDAIGSKTFEKQLNQTAFRYL